MIFARWMVATSLVVLASCTQTTPALVATEVYRNPSAQIASQTNVTAQRMSGDWVVRQGFAGQSGPVGAFSVEAGENGTLTFIGASQRCTTEGCRALDTVVLLAPVGPGRWKSVGASAVFPELELWVLWMDFDDRTAAIGTPSGQFGWIMDKNTTGGGDRITAARDIMEWFGYNMAQLEEVRR